MIKQSSFGNWLENKLKNVGMSQAELSREVKCSRSTINGLIKGGAQPGNKLCKAIARALRIPPEEVFIAAGLLPNRNMSQQDHINHLLSLLSNEDRQDIIDYINMKIDQKERKHGGEVHQSQQLE